MTESWSLVLVLGLSMAVSFFLSGMEAGAFALNPVRIRHWMHTGRRGAATLHGFLERPENFLWTILVGNTLANFVVVALLVGFLYRLGASHPGWALGAFLPASFLFYALCDLLPKLLFRALPNRLCLLLVGPFRLLHTLLQPLVIPIHWGARRLLPQGDTLAGLGPLSQSRGELRQSLLESNPALTGEERAMIARALELHTLKASQLATPLERTVTVPAELPLTEVLALCRERRLTRLPVWEGAGPERRVAGIISLRSLLYRSDLEGARRAAGYMQPALFLPADLSAGEVLRRMQRSGQRLAILLDAANRETGVVSLEDLLRFLLGTVTT